MAAAIEYAHIVSSPDLFQGEPRVEGHRIRVRDVAWARDRGGHSPEEIAGVVYPSLTLGEVYSALAYYEDHRSEIDAAGQAETETVARLASVASSRKP